MRRYSISKTMMMPLAILLATVALVVATVVHAEAHFGAMKFSTSHDDQDPGTQVFAADTAKIYLHADLEEVPSGAKLSATWIAEKTDVAPPDYKIDSAEFAVADGINEATFSLSKPSAGWPAGDYRVELFIDSKPAGAARFRVEAAK